MTCIVGIAHEGKVYMGADSMASDGYTRHTSALRKVFKVGEFLIGYTSSFRMGQILQYHLEVPHQQDGITDERYMIVEFVTAVRKCLKEHGYARVDSNTESGGTFLVGYNGIVYRVEDYYQINHWTNGVDACGAGEQYALGALMALPDLPPMERIQRALQISAELSALVIPPFHIEVLE